MYVFLIIDTLKSKALLFHLMNVTEMMQSGMKLSLLLYFHKYFINIIIALLIAGMAVAVVNCGKYTDVCEAFSIHQFPTIKHRLGITWTVRLFKREQLFFQVK